MKTKIRKYIALTSALLALLSMLGIPAAAAESASAEAVAPEIEGCASYYLYNFENDRVLASSNIDTLVYPASAVKLMTGIIAVETLGDDLDRRITVTSDMLASAAGNKLGLVAGEEVSVRDMLYACLEGGANDAALVLAHTVAGSTDEFVSLMNTKAALLGAYDTHYTNPTGLHDDAMVTTAADTAMIAKYAAGIPLMCEITASQKYVMEKTNLKDFRNIYNRNCLISKFYDTYDTPYRYERATGMNAGSTSRSGSVVIATAKNSDGDLSYLAVLMGAYSDESVNYAYAGAITLFDWAFSAWDYLDVLSEEELICEIPVSLSSAVDSVALSPKTGIRVYLPTSTDLESELDYSYTTLYDSLPAPIRKGETAGAVTVLYKGEVIGSAELITTIDIERSELLYTLSQIEQFTSSRFFIGTAVAAVVLTAAYIFFNARIKNKPHGF